MATPQTQAPENKGVDKTANCAILDPVEKLPERTRAGLLMLRRMLKGSAQYADRVVEVENGAVDRPALQALSAEMKSWAHRMEEVLRGQGVKV